MKIRSYVHHALSLLFTSAIFAVSSAVFTSLLLRNLGAIVGMFVEAESGAEFDFALIFEQTKNAELSFFWLVPLLLGALLYIADKILFYKIESKRVRGGLKYFFFFSFLFSSYLLTLLFTKVNDVRFIDLLYKLVPLIDKL